jgi:hypothetical protein
MTAYAHSIDHQRQTTVGEQNMVVWFAGLSFVAFSALIFGLGVYVGRQSDEKRADFDEQDESEFEPLQQRCAHNIER